VHVCWHRSQPSAISFHPSAISYEPWNKLKADS
jgi:hypothetical protein